MSKLTKQTYTMRKSCVYSHRKCIIIFCRCVFFKWKTSCRFSSILFLLLIIMCTFPLKIWDIFHRPGSLWWILAAPNKPIQMRKEKLVWDEHSAPGQEGGQHVPSPRWRKSIWTDSSSRSSLICLNLSTCFLRSTSYTGLLCLYGYI